MKILSKSYVESLRIVGNKFHNLHTNPRFHHCYFYNFIEIKHNCLRSHSKITCKGMIARQHGHCFLNGKWFSHLPFYANINTINAKFQAHCTKSFGDLKEDRFLRFHNDNWNMFMNTSKGNTFFNFEMLPRHVPMAWNFQRTEIKYLFHFKAFFHAQDITQVA